MTARQIIKRIMDSVDSIDDDVKLYIIHRDEQGCCTSKSYYNAYNVINGKIYVENDYIDTYS
jgi:hypothetical protein